MPVPAGFVPYVATARRYHFLYERAQRREQEAGIADAHRALRLEQVGTPLWRRLPGAARLATAGVLAVEEVLGAGVAELRAYGLDRRTAEALITELERIAANMTTFASGPRAGQIYDQDPVTLVASAARTASYTSPDLEVGDRATLRLELVVTALSAGAQLHVQVETRRDASDAWRLVDAFLVATTTGTQRRAMSGCDRLVRAVCTLSGPTPAATFAVAGEAL